MTDKYVQDLASGELDKRKAAKLEKLAGKINEKHHQCESAFTSGLQLAIEAGVLLEEAKNTVGFGHWLGWLEENFEGSVRTAQGYMRVARKREALESLNAQRVAHLGLQDALKGLAEPSAKEKTEDTRGENFDNTIEPASAENGQALARPRGAIAQLEEDGMTVPPPPRGYTHEEKVYGVLCDFRDTMRKMPSDPKAVARVTEPHPLGALGTVDDFGELIEWMRQFHQELVRVVERERRRREDLAREDLA